MSRTKSVVGAASRGKTCIVTWFSKGVPAVLWELTEGIKEVESLGPK